MSTSEPEIEAILLARLDALGDGSDGGDGARWAAKRTLPQTAGGTARVTPARLDDAVRVLAALLQTTPEVAPDDPATAVVHGVVRSGFGNLNAVHARVTVGAGGLVRAAAYAKEGLIKQRTAARAVQRILAALPN